MFTAWPSGLEIVIHLKEYNVFKLLEYYLGQPDFESASD